MRRNFLCGIGVGLALVAGAAFAQTPAAAPAFEVASIKPAPPLNPSLIASGKMHLGMTVDAARVDVGNLSLADLIRIAYRVKSNQLTGPDWMGAQRFDVMAKMPEGASREQVPEMLQALLAERFKLAVHREKKEQPVYALVVGKTGPKMKESPPDADVPAADGAGPSGQATAGNQVRISSGGEGKGVVMSAGQRGTVRMSAGPEGTMHMETSKLTMTALAEMLSRFVDRPVVDMTELKGNYQVALDLSMADLRNVAKAAGALAPGLAAGGDAGRQPADAASDPSGTSIFSSVQQLGLKLEPRKEAIERIVVDHLEKTPTDN